MEVNPEVAGPVEALEYVAEETPEPDAVAGAGGPPEREDPLEPDAVAGAMDVAGEPPEPDAVAGAVGPLE